MTIQPLASFDELNLPPALKASLAAMNYTAPTPIQSQSIPFAIAGRDLLATAMTGSGKTAAFGIPMIARMLTNSRGSALILTPTRELATQVQAVIKQLLGQYSTIKTALLIGGDSMPKQMQELRARPRIIIGTPGRMIDHLERGSVMMHDTNYLVLDEMDRMLDMGFEDQILKIMKYLPVTRQTLLFSATLPPQILKIAERYLNNPERVAIGELNKAADRIEQAIRHVNQDEKYGVLVEELQRREGTAIIFVRAKFATEKLAQRLCKSGITADAIHGDLDQRKRERVLKAFRDQHHRVLVATDIASRGLDIPHIEHVINYDLPQMPEDYIHRIGRTARAGAEGSALSFITPDDELKWYEIQKLMNPDLQLPRPAAAKKSSSRGRGGKGGSGGSSNGGGRSGGSAQAGHGGRSGARGGRSAASAASPAAVAPTLASSNDAPRTTAPRSSTNRRPAGGNANQGGSNGGSTHASAKTQAPQAIQGLPSAI